MMLFKLWNGESRAYSRLTWQNDPIRERLSISDEKIGVLNAESARKKKRSTNESLRDLY